jgi:hypothetical protein
MATQYFFIFNSFRSVQFIYTVFLGKRFLDLKDIMFVPFQFTLYNFSCTNFFFIFIPKIQLSMY